jgi:hypothetical protein
VCVGSARLSNAIIIPCKVVLKNNQPQAHVPYNGQKIVDDFSILHVDSSLMKWVPIHEMRTAGHHAIRPVEAGFDESHSKLYYPYAEIHGMKVPGQAVSAYSCGFFAFEG